jgi:hypothetical protein
MTIEVKKVTLEGTVESVEPLSDEWHMEHVGPRKVGAVATWIENGYPDGKYFTTRTVFENPFDCKYPAVMDDFPIPEGEAVDLEGRKVTFDFYVHRGGLYQISVFGAYLQGGGTDVLIKATDNCDPPKITNFKVKE